MVASAFTIRELTGQQRTVVLTDRGLPYRPFELTTKQRVELTWYPGNPQATATVLGAAEDPTSITGAWKDKYLAPLGENVLQPITLDGEQVANARDACRVFDSIVREGQEVEVTWDDQTRRGFITEFRKRWLNVHDVEWEMRFEWISRGEPTAPAVVAQSTSPDDAASQFEQKNASLQNNAIVKFAMSLSTMTTLLTSLSAINVATAGARTTVNELTRQSISPSSAARRMVAVCNALLTSTDELTQFLASRPAFALIDAGVPIEDIPFARRIVAYRYARRLIGDAREMARLAIEYRAAMLQQIEEQLLGIYTSRSGDDLRSISRAYYGTPFEWRRLLLFNNLRSNELAPGTLVLIPQFTVDTREA